jgi:hypothetical protein
MVVGASRTQRRIERRLFEVHDRLRRARDELEVIETQLAALAEQADEARVRMLVSETPGAGRDWREAAGHAERITASRDRKRAEIATLESAQDELLGQLVV